MQENPTTTRVSDLQPGDKIIANSELLDQIQSMQETLDDLMQKNVYPPLNHLLHPIIPEGWVLVPVEPTGEMEMAGQTVPIPEECFIGDFRSAGYGAQAIYKTMLKVAPKPYGETNDV
jgi:hypothetical protein